jgi:hypothetical protein
MLSRKLSALSVAVALSLAAASQAAALNPQPEPPNKPRLSKPRVVQGHHYRTLKLPPSPCRHVVEGRCR